MTEEKNINDSKQENQPQDKLADELLTEEELDKVAGGSILNPEAEASKRVVGETSGK